MARLFLRHHCSGTGFDLHEALYSRAGIPKSHQAYVMDRHNVISVCHPIHMAFGSTNWFRRQAARVLVDLYGEAAIRFYLDTAPFRQDRLTLDGILAAEDPPVTAGYRWLGVPESHKQRGPT